MNRRNFIQFLGFSSMALSLPPTLVGYASTNKKTPLLGLLPGLEDKLVTADGLEHKILMRWGDKINSIQTFGFNNDFLAFHPLEKDRGILWVNHEYVNSLFIKGPARTKANIDLERLEVGGSLIEIKKVKDDWVFVKDSLFNRRIDATTKIPFAWHEPIKEQNFAIGTMSNCAGGYTPWGTILTCEENYDMFIGERDRKGNFTKSYQGWEQVYPVPPEHYGWVVEVAPKTGIAKKLISLGRCAHECATVTRAKNEKIVVYTGDDATNEHLYKFVSETTDSLEKGKLYVANLEQGRWISLDINDQPVLKKNFKNQTEIQIYIRDAAKLLGATPLDRPEDIEIDPLTGHVFIALTNNKSKKNYYGSILKIMETDGDHAAMTFKHEVFLTGGKEAGFACPDNMVFDPKGNLWFTSDMSDYDIDRGPYEGLGNNGLFVFIRSGNHAGKIIRLASAPRDAEFTGPCFSPDHQTLFLSVQHPGESTKTIDRPASTWPDGNIPRPCVVTLRGPLLNKIVGGYL